MNILFSEEKMFDIDGVSDFQNGQIWVENREAADTKDGIR